MKTHVMYPLSAVFVAVLLAGCGGGGGDGDAPVAPVAPVVPPVVESPNKFTQSAEWKFTLPATGVSVCYDFNTKTEVAGCTGNTWDLKVKSGGRSAELFTNSGSSGTGAGGAFGSPFVHTWTKLLTWQNALTDPTSGPIPATLYAADAAKNTFSGSNSIQSAAFEYGVGGDTDHLLYPNYRVFLVTTKNSVADAVGTTDSPVFAVQLTGYYGGAGGTASGYPSFRWIDQLSKTQKTATVNASAGWVYYNLATASEVAETGTWHIAFNRYNVKLNGGTSGNGTVGGFVGATPAGFYAADGVTPVAAKFKAATPADTLADLTGVLKTPANAAGWIKDAVASQLSPAYTGTYPNALNYGWFSYHPTDAVAIAAGLAGQHMLKANPENATLVRSGEGTSYARIRLSSIAYAAVAAGAPAYTGAQTWTLQMDVQPAP